MAIVAPAALACGGTDPVDPGPEPPAPVVVETANFQIVDQAAAPQSLLDSLAEQLEIEHARVAALFPEFVPPEVITFNLRPGNGIPFVSPANNSMNQWLETLSLDYIPHQLTHLWTRYTRRPFLEEGIAVFVTEMLRPESRTVNPYRGQSPHAWVSLYASRGALISLFTAFRADNFSFAVGGSTGDAFAWQVFVEAGSFTRWVMDRFGRDTWFRMFQTQNLSDALGATTADLEREWLAAVQAAVPSPLPCREAIGPVGSREAFWCARVGE